MRRTWRSRLYAIAQGTARQAATASNINLHTESAAGQSVATRFGTSNMTKRVELRFLFAQEMVVKGLIILRKLDSGQLSRRLTSVLRCRVAEVPCENKAVCFQLHWTVRFNSQLAFQSFTWYQSREVFSKNGHIVCPACAQITAGEVMSSGTIPWRLFVNNQLTLQFLTSAVCGALAVGLSWFQTGCAVSIGRWAGFLGPRLHATSPLYVDVNDVVEALLPLNHRWTTGNEASQRVPLKHNSRNPLTQTQKPCVPLWRGPEQRTLDDTTVREIALVKSFNGIYHPVTSRDSYGRKEDRQKGGFLGWSTCWLMVLWCTL